MRLFYGPASPYARMVRIALMETGLDELVRKQEVTLRDPGSSPSVMALETTRVNRSADVLERAVFGGAYAGPISASQIVLGCALGWIDPVHPVWRRRDERPALAAWYNAIATRPSFDETVPLPP